MGDSLFRLLYLSPDTHLRACTLTHTHTHTCGRARACTLPHAHTCTLCHLKGLNRRNFLAALNRGTDVRGVCTPVCILHGVCVWVCLCACACVPVCVLACASVNMCVCLCVCRWETEETKQRMEENSYLEGDGKDRSNSNC